MERYVSGFIKYTEIGETLIVRSILDSFFLKEMVEGADTTRAGLKYFGALG